MSESKSHQVASIVKSVKETRNIELLNLVSSVLQHKKLNQLRIKINKFKKVDSVELTLESINIFIGSNNSGKSSFIQGIQFATSSCQTLELKKVSWKKKTDSRTLALDSSDYLYTPTRQIENLYHGEPLTGSKKKSKKNISFTTLLGNTQSRLFISKGRNGGFTTHQVGMELGKLISNIDAPFCVYVPGIAGIPIEEKYEVPIGIKKSATRGDSNNYLRNIIRAISADKNKWNSFHTSINNIYSGIELRVNFDENVFEFIDVDLISSQMKLPIDSVGTGVLQTVQIFAYLEYFKPRILLLDEPDSHIHPTKQKLLAQELSRRTKDDQNLKIVISTHSRYILDALEGRAQVVHFQNGSALTNIVGSKILLDIGAADTDYLFSKKTLKFIIATEDRVDGVEAKKEFLKKFALANGLSEEEFVLHSYEGCTKVHFAKILEGFVKKHIPNARVILHFDRDQRDDNDVEIERLKSDCLRENILLFITELSEIENYYCLPRHIHERTGIPMNQCQSIYDTCHSELEEETKRKIKNFILNSRPDLCKRNGRIDVGLVDAYADALYARASRQVTPGKELIGKIKNVLQNNKVDPLLLLDPSKGLHSERFNALMK